jgi:hypothetical protein
MVAFIKIAVQLFADVVAFAALLYSGRPSRSKLRIYFFGGSGLFSRSAVFCHGE